MYELDKLEAVVGQSLRIDEDALRAGRLEVEFEWPLDGNRVPLKAIYPDSFPRLRPIVCLRTDFSQFPKRHCSPIDGNLCLLGRDTAQWPEDWTLTDLLTNQLRDALSDTGEQDPQGEPADFWWNLLGLRNSYCLVDSSWDLKGATAGQLTLRYEIDTKANDPFAVRAVVAEIRNDKGEPICIWDSKVPLNVVPGGAMMAPWFYSEETILPIDLQRRVPQIVERFKSKPRALDLTPAKSGRVYAVAHKTELGPGQSGLGWIFIIEHGHRKAFLPARPGKTTRHPAGSFIPVFRAGTGDIGARAPAAKVLIDKKIAVIGVGAIGAPLAIDLARNGCSQLELVDHDLVEPGNSIRWSLGASTWGRPKAIALAEFIEREYPWCKVHHNVHRLGGSNNIGDNAKLTEVLADAHLTIDASATYGISMILSDYCRERELPLISFYASPPVTGGAVGYFHPRSGCPTCLEMAHSNNSIPRAPGFGSQEGMQQPPGCSEMTFTGASYDLSELSLQAMRVVAKALTKPPTESIIYTLSLPGGSEPPSWATHTLQRFDECWCARKP